jgi:site-specific DNA recombinase
VSVLGAAPYGYRYVPRAEGGPRYDIVLSQAAVMRQVFTWVGQDRLSLGEVCRRLQEQGAPTPSGQGRWQRGTLAQLLRNTTYKGEALYGRHRIVERRMPLRLSRGQSAVPRRPKSSRTSEGTEPTVIPVPALVSAELFEQVAEQLQEYRKRLRCRLAQANYLLQGLLVCGRCGYALYGHKGHWKDKAGQAKEYVYYQCGGRRMKDEAGAKKCSCRGVHGAALDEAVWADVCALLREPERVEQEYQRRLQGGGGDNPNTDTLNKQMAVANKVIARLIDAYGEGLLEKAEFEPRLRQARERLARLQESAKAEAETAEQEAELRLALGRLQQFAQEIQEGLDNADWRTRREIVRAVVREIVVAEQEVRVVYRVPHRPVDERPHSGNFQDRRTREGGLLSLLAIRTAPVCPASASPNRRIQPNRRTPDRRLLCVSQDRR